MLRVEEATIRILSGLSPLDAETVAIADALGRVLAVDLAAKWNQPPADMSAMDGYAVRAADVANAPVLLRLIGESAAGHGFAGVVGPGEAARIFTGAPLPQGADCVVIQENTQTVAAGIRVEIPAPQHANIRRAGIDFVAASVGLAAGARMTPSAIGLAAAMGHGRVDVVKRPVVALLATGDELVAAGEVPGPAGIVNSNGPMLAAAIRAWGGEVRDLGIAGDNEADLIAAAAGFAGADLILSVGGASVGDHDLIQPVLSKHGLAVDFWKIAMRPGKPLIHGAFRGTPFLGLPGNPVSALVCAKLFVEPMLATLSGAGWPGHRYRRARAGHPLGGNGARMAFLRASLSLDAGGETWVNAADNQDSSLLSVLAHSPALWRREIDAPAVRHGDPQLVLEISLDGRERP